MRTISCNDILALRRWRTAEGESNSEQLARLRTYLPRAIDEELTGRQKQIVSLYFYDGLTVCQIARQLQLSPSTVSRTLSRATNRIQHVLSYTL